MFFLKYRRREILLTVRVKILFFVINIYPRAHCVLEHKVTYGILHLSNRHDI